MKLTETNMSTLHNCRPGPHPTNPLPTAPPPPPLCLLRQLVQDVHGLLTRAPFVIVDLQALVRHQTQPLYHYRDTPTKVCLRACRRACVTHARIYRIFLFVFFLLFGYACVRRSV